MTDFHDDIKYEAMLARTGIYRDLGPFSAEPFQFFREIEANLAYPDYSLLPTFLETEVFPTCFEDDPHWNADGARVAAERIAEILEVELERTAASGT